MRIRASSKAEDLRSTGATSRNSRNSRAWSCSGWLKDLVLRGLAGISIGSLSVVESERLARGDRPVLANHSLVQISLQLFLGISDPISHNTYFFSIFDPALLPSFFIFSLNWLQLPNSSLSLLLSCAEIVLDEAAAVAARLFQLISSTGHLELSRCFA